MRLRSFGLATRELIHLAVVIMHVKDDTWPLPVSVAPPTPHPLGPGKVPVHDSMRDWIGHEIDELEKTHKLGCRIVMARQGDRFRAFRHHSVVRFAVLTDRCSFDRLLSAVASGLDSACQC